jgi:serine beta-lactamase-like protein LACTB
MKLARNQSSRPHCALWVHLAILVALCSAVGIRCTAQESKLAPAKLTQIQAAISKFMASTHVPGLSIAIVENGEYEWAQGFGFADLENNVPANEHTLFRLASISKPLSATAALQLWERGKLDLDAPVQRYCPSFPQKPWPKMIPKSATLNTLTIPSKPD